jgi:hypothetical protein
LGLKKGEADRTAGMRDTEISTGQKQGKPIDKTRHSLKFCKKYEVCAINLFDDTFFSSGFDLA